MRRGLRPLLFVCGCLCLALGAVGVFLPVLPTTPFVLLAAACFVRSSPRLHAWILRHPLFGPPVRDFQAGLGISRRAKVVAISMLWASVLATVHLHVEAVLLDVLLVLLAVGVTVYLLRLPTRKPSPRAAPSEAGVD